MIYNVYCDESCHLENDKKKVMVIGAIWCPIDYVKTINKRIKEIKIKHGMSSKFEIKWTKVSHAKIQMYLDFMNYFFDDEELHFRTLVIPDKSKLNHQQFDQSHDTWHYKMYFDLLKVLLDPYSAYYIYLDIKDTKSSHKIKKLHEVLCNDQYDFSQEIIKGVQTIHSHEVGILQLTDLLIGAVLYKHNNLFANEGKKVLVNRMIERSGYDLLKTTLYKENKVNILIWNAS